VKPARSGSLAAPLPIDPLLPEIARALSRASRLVIVAPPGAGKTTRVPLTLLDAPWLGQRKVVLLEPRRLAARAAARRMAAALGERVGETVGYRVHLDTVVGRTTRLEVVTEGVLTRMLQTNVTLDDVGAVLFDEFHERSLHADLGLALTLHAQRLVREDLRVIVMSATLDGIGVARAIDAPLLQSEGRAYPVVTHYRPRRERERTEDAVVRVTREAMEAHGGDALIFLPGGAEIRRTSERLIDAIDDPSVDVRPLYGDLAGDAQDAAIQPGIAGRRKVVVATNIAETSLTIEGVRVVIDAGLVRAPRFSARTGLTRLETLRVSAASADQRRGRAGRVAPGVCYRLWNQADDAQLAPRNTPEILDADLAPLALELAVAGIDDPGDLTWLDPPPAGSLTRARELLKELGALSPDDRITPHGRALGALPTHPRIAHLLLRGRSAGQSALACDLAALLGNRDPLRPAEPGARVDADVRARLEVIAGAHAATAARVDRDAVRRIRQDARLLRERLGAGAGTSDPELAGVLLAFAYPDRIAQRRPDTHGRFVLSNGTGAHFDDPQPLGSEEWLVIAETDGRAPESRIYLAAPVTLDALIAYGAAQLVSSDTVEWDARADRVVAARRTMLGAIVVREQALKTAAPELVHATLVAALRQRGIRELPWSDGARRIRERLAFMRRHDATWPDVGDEALSSSLETWLGPFLGDARSLADVARADTAGALLSLVDWKRRAELEALAPTHIEVPTGSHISIDYSDPATPAIAVRLQELYGLPVTPAILGGRVPLTLQLLSPAHRPVQITRDLAAFWRGSYAEVRKEMRGRYPKHDWPDDPAHAAPSRGRKRR
jgi:ATP-dependent helicase HrpB